MGIDKYIVANFNGTYSHKHLNGNAFEALVGAVYLDKGYDFANRFVINGVLRRYVDLSDITTTEVDFKSRLIEWCQKSKRSIHFNTASDEESTMRNPRFLSKIIIDGIELGHGTGSSKKEAEQKAAWAVTQIVGNDALRPGAAEHHIGRRQRGIQRRGDRRPHSRCLRRFAAGHGPGRHDALAHDRRHRR